jgi:hypothetical protein
MKLNDFFKPTINENLDVGEFKKILKVFLPFAKKYLKLDRLPTIILKKTINSDHQPTMGRFHNSNEYKLELAIANRHPVDALRTLAHELVHSMQHIRQGEIDGDTGSQDENEAHILAGAMMRDFNQAYPELLKLKAIAEGGNLAIGQHQADQINLQVTNRSVIVPVLNNVLNAINSGYAKSYKEPLWDPALLKSGEFLSGSSLHFFNVKGIPDETFVAKKPKVGDIDTQVDRDKVENLTAFLTAMQGKNLGPATLLGFQKGNEQYSSLWELSEFPIKVQIDLEFVAYDQGKPTAWSQFSHSSSWEDIQAGVKGVFHKFLIQSLASLSKKEFLLRKLVGRGKARAEQDVPEEDHMVSFAVSSKEGGGLRAKYEPVYDEQGLPLIKDGLPVLRALPPENYEQDIDKIFMTLFGDKLGPKQAKAMSKQFWSFTGLLNVMNQLLDDSEKQRVAESFIRKLFDKGAQGLYKGDPERDSAEKTAALNLMLKTLGVQAPADLEQMKADYKASYKVTSESVMEAIGEAGGEGAPNYKRQGIQHIYNPGSSTEMKDMDFIAMAKEIADNGGKLDGMAINLKADGAGIRFGKDESGRPFFMTSKVTEPKYLDNVGDFERYGQEQGQSADRLAFTKKYDDAMNIILNSEFIKSLPSDTIVQAEMMYNPMAQKSEDGLKFVSIPYDPKKLGKTMTLVPFMFKRYSTGETLPDADKIKQKLLSMSSPEIKMVNNQLEQQGVDVSKIIDPVVNMSPELVSSLTSRVKNNPQKEQAKEILTQARKQLSDTIINSPQIAGKDQLGNNIEGLVVNLPSGRLAKVTSSMMKSAVAAKQAAKKTGPTKTAVVAIGSFVGHIGHEQLWDYTVKKAAELGGTPYLFIGHGVGKDDPIPPPVKVQTWQRLYPEYKNNISTVQVEGGSLMQKIKHELINPQPGQPPKYDNIVIMVGEDQAKMNIAQALMKAVNKFPGYEHVKVELQATPRGTGMSFTKLRNILKDPKATPEEQYALWAQGFDEKKLGKDWILHLMDVARKGMNVTPTHTSPSGAKTNMRPDDDDYEINYGKNGAAAMNKDKQVAEDATSMNTPLRRFMIKQINRITGWGTSELELSSDEEIEDLFAKYVPGSEKMIEKFNKAMQEFTIPKTEDAAGVGVIASRKQAKDPRYSMSLTKDVRPGAINKALKAFKLEAMLPKSAFAGSDKHKLGPSAHLKGGAGGYAKPGHLVGEAPIEMDPADPMDPMIYGHDKANPAKLKYRMMRASNQLKDLAARAAGASPAEWQIMARQFEELKMNMEQIRHALEELGKQRRKGGIKSRGIDKTIDENDTDAIVAQTNQKADSAKAIGTSAVSNTTARASGDAESAMSNAKASADAAMKQESYKHVKIGEGWEYKISTLVEQLSKK